MLYVTTRSQHDHFPALRTLGQNRGPDGGLYVPFRLPWFDRDAVEALKEKNFGVCMAEILNLLFSPRTDGVDVNFTIGRSPVKLRSMSHRIVVAEAWHNPNWDFSWMVQALAQRIKSEVQASNDATEWAWIAVRIGTLFGVFAELERNGMADWEHPMDVAVTSGDFSGPMAAWYAREMGLPIGTIICGCNENGAPWDLLHRGELRTNETAVTTETVQGDWAVPRGLERLIHGRLGTEEVQNYCQICYRGGIYAPNPAQTEVLRQGMFAAVISQRRMERVISSVYRTNRYVLSPYSALAYAGLQDYRATAGEGRLALLLTEQSPACCAESVAKALGITVKALKAQLDNA